MATDRPGRYLLATIHLLSHTPGRPGLAALAPGRIYPPGLLPYRLAHPRSREPA
jgi:hypothetical protein